MLNFQFSLFNTQNSSQTQVANVCGAALESGNEGKLSELGQSKNSSPSS